MSVLTLTTPDDFHVHFREDQMLRDVAKYTSARFARALVMPNTKKPILTGHDAAIYRSEIVQITGVGFRPLMTIKLVNQTTPAVIDHAHGLGVVAGKLYPEGVTTNSEDGVRGLENLWEVFAAMEEKKMVLCLHGESPGVFCMDREAAFLSDLSKISEAFPDLKIVLEHVTTRAAVHAVLELPNVAATITAHHLLLTLDDVIGGLIDPHSFCKPIAKTPDDRKALIEAATSGSPKFFFGSDSAPHLRGLKECSGGCAGIFSAPCALEVLATIFEAENKIEYLNHFVSEFGARFYGLQPNAGHIYLHQEMWIVPCEIAGIVPFMAGKKIFWKFRDWTSY